MQALGFTAPISNNGLDLAVAAFDDHSCLSGRQYRAIEHHNVNSKHDAERSDVEPNASFSMTSYMTEIVPLIMSIGKSIGRSLSHFFIDEQERQKVLAPLDLDVQNRDQYIQELKRQALDTFKQATPLTFPQLSCSLTPEQEDCLEEAIKNRHGNQHSLQRVSVVRGGVNYVLFLDSLPGFVFKPMGDRKKAEEYVKIAERARQIVVDNNFYLLHVPESKVIEINGSYFVTQEKVELISDNYYEQKGIYQCYWEDERMEDYMKELFSQLLQFICIFHFRDVKYDNIPLTKDGRVALFDLDRDNAIEGLTRGCAGKHDGLFNYIPIKYIDHFMTIAKAQLAKGFYQQLELKMAVIRSRAEKKAKKEEGYLDFAKKNSITISSQLLNPDLPILFKDEKRQEFAKFVVESINSHLSQSKNFSIRIGRITALGISILDKLNEKVLSIWGPKLPYLSLQGGVSFVSILSEVLDGLKEAGYIYKYKLDRSYDYVRIDC